MDSCFINTVAQGYPSDPNFQIVQNYREFFEALQYIISNSDFRSKYTDYLRHHPVEAHLQCRGTLRKWCQGVCEQVKRCESDVVWEYLLLIGHNYPTKPNFQEVLLYKNFFLTLGNVFPDNHQRRQYLDYLRKMPIDQYLSSKDYLQNWIRGLYKDIDDQNTEYIIEDFSGFSSYHVLVPCLLILTIFLIKKI